MKHILSTYADSVGLKINFQKCSLIPMNLTEDEAITFAGIFGRKVGSVPFTYLGLPMGTTKPSATDLMPLVCKIERRLS